MVLRQYDLDWQSSFKDSEWRQRIGRLFRCRSGTAAVEFAIVVLPFLAMVFLIFQVALYHFSLQSLDYATRVAARQVMVGSVHATSAASFKKDVLCPNILVAYDCDKIQVNAYKVEANSDQATSTGIYRFIDAATNTMKRTPGSSFCLGGASDYIFLDVSYEFPNFFDFETFFARWSSTPRTPGKIWTLRATTFFRNEPLVVGNGSC